MTPLILIDIQRGFINEHTAHIPAAAAALQDRFTHVLITRFVNPPGSMHRKLMQWERFAPGSDDTELAFAPAGHAQVFDKSTYSCLTPEVRQALTRDSSGTIYLAGIATDNCVLKTAVDLFEAGITPKVIADACASHGGADAHACGLMLLGRFIGTDQLITISDLPA